MEPSATNTAALEAAKRGLAGADSHKKRVSLLGSRTVQRR